MKYDISFIHTGQAHIKKFSAIVDELNSQLNINHVVDESLLIHAQEFGADAWLATNLKVHLEALSLTSKVIVVTCSSIGAMAEDIGQLNGCKVQRIDQAMADHAVKHGKKILVMAALESTLAPTRELLAKSMKQQGVETSFSFCLVENAWEDFLSGHMNNYYTKIASAISENEKQYDLIVLAQASMSEVEKHIKVSIPVISSPRLGVKRALQALKS